MTKQRIFSTSIRLRPTLSRNHEQESEEIDYGVIARLNPETGEIENLEILSFSARVSSSEGLTLPIIADLRLPERT